MESTDRTAYVAGLRALADLLDAHPDVPLPTTGGGTAAVDWLLFGAADLELDAQKAVAARIVQVLPRPVRKRDTADLYRFSAELHGLHVEVIVDRPAVCERVVTGTKTVTREVPDPAAPKVTVTEEVETAEWVCRPLLAEMTA
jgi:hypothetical protein